MDALMSDNIDVTGCRDYCGIIERTRLIILAPYNMTKLIAMILNRLDIPLELQTIMLLYYIERKAKMVCTITDINKDAYYEHLENNEEEEISKASFLDVQLYVDLGIVTSIDISYDFTHIASNLYNNLIESDEYDPSEIYLVAEIISSSCNNHTLRLPVMSFIRQIYSLFDDRQSIRNHCLIDIISDIKDELRSIVRLC